MTFRNSVPSICAIIVTYNPDITRLSATLGAVSGQVGRIIIVDNCSAMAIRTWLNSASVHELACVTFCEQNLGIASAINIGIDVGSAQGFDHFLLLDHDSVPAPNMVAKLLEAERDLVSLGRSVAAVGPKLRDANYPAASRFARLKGVRLVRENCDEEPDRATIRTDYLVTSGSLIRRSIIEQLGNMDSSLFIDYVDVEWALRAQSKGFFCFGVCNAILDHQLGDSTIRVWGRSVPVRSPLRHYYLIRNGCRLLRRRYVPIRWKVVELFRLFLKYVFYALATPPRWENLRMMTLGVLHAARDRGGSYADDASKRCSDQ